MAGHGRYGMYTYGMYGRWMATIGNIYIYTYIYIYGISVAEACQRPLKLLTQLEWRRPVAQGPGEARRGQARPGEANVTG